MARVVVTGGAGFIGSHTVDALVEKGLQVTVVDDLSFGKKAHLSQCKEKIRFVEGDICDSALMEKECKGAESIIHLAALRSVQMSLEKPKEYNEVNILGTLNVLEAARKNDVKKIVSASSSSVYGLSKELPLKESSSLHPLSPYGLTKLVGEQYFKMYDELYGIGSVSLRYFNVFGPRQDPESEYSTVIPRFICRILRNQKPQIYGDGKQTRDFTYIKNVVNANLLSMAYKKRGAHVFNVSAGKNVSLLELLGEIQAVLGTSVSPEFLEARKGEPRDTLGDSTNAGQELGFKSGVGLKEGLRETAEFFKA